MGSSWFVTMCVFASGIHRQTEIFVGYDFEVMIPPKEHEDQWQFLRSKFYKNWTCKCLIDRMSSSFDPNQFWLLREVDLKIRWHFGKRQLMQHHPFLNPPLPPPQTGEKKLIPGLTWPRGPIDHRENLRAGSERGRLFWKSGWGSCEAAPVTKFRGESLKIPFEGSFAPSARGTEGGAGLGPPGGPFLTIPGGGLAPGSQKNLLVRPARAG